MLNGAYMAKVNETVLGLMVVSLAAAGMSGCANNMSGATSAKKVPAAKTQQVKRQPQPEVKVVVVNKPRQTAGVHKGHSKDDHHIAYDKKRMWYNQQWLVKQETEARQRVQRQKYQQQYQRKQLEAQKKQQQYQQQQYQQQKQLAWARQSQQRVQQQHSAARQQHHNRYKLRQAQIEARHQQNNWQRHGVVNQRRHYSPAVNHNNFELARHLSNAAISRTSHRIRYDGRYIPISYPMGDVPANMGVCTDVVIRSYRRLGVDLQRLVHEDMSRAFHAYPNLSKWRLTAPDPNIDHRRVHNLRAFFTRNGLRLPITNNPQDYRPGDLVTWSLGGDQGHIGIVVDRRSPVDPNRYMIVHNIDSGTKMEDVLFNWPITGHFRYFPGRQPMLAAR